jgi:hypothetical protein
MKKISTIILQPRMLLILGKFAFITFSYQIKFSEQSCGEFSSLNEQDLRKKHVVI